MPQNYIGGGEANSLKTNLDVITGFGALGLDGTDAKGC